MPHVAPLPVTDITADPAAVRDALQGDIGAIELARPTLDTLPYAPLIRGIVAATGFKIEFNRLAPDQAVAMIADRLIGPGSFAPERALLAADIARLVTLMEGIAGARASVAVRTYFAPGDLVWHVDRLAGRAAYRLVWPIGRPAGMHVTSRTNIDIAMYRAFMRREYPLLCRVDGTVARSGAAIEQLWAHRPAQLQAMRSGAFPFVLDPADDHTITPGAASIHRVETPATPGTFHRSSWANRDQPGFQIIVTAASDAG